MIISVERTSALLAPRFACSSCLARSTEMSEAEQPIPDKLYVLISDLISNLEATNAQREGVGEKREQLMIRTSISFG